MTRREEVARAIYEAQNWMANWDVIAPVVQAALLCQADYALAAADRFDAAQKEYGDQEFPEIDEEVEKPEDYDAISDFYERNGLR